MARDLEAYIGPSGRVSEVLNRKRPLSLRMVKQLHEWLAHPAREPARRDLTLKALTVEERASRL